MMLQEDTPAPKGNYTTPGEIDMNESSFKQIEQTHERLHGDSGQQFLGKEDAAYPSSIKKKDNNYD